MTLLEILEAAIAQPLGIVVTTNKPDALKRKLYIEMRQCRETRDERFLQITITPGVEDNELLVRLKESNAP
ncbi:hypothetical protein LCGC14_2974250 [marine sediment metagenome]|uniref:Uncharacterized protein n=1 Tax=marine sediment metagenome TaxID=412755 RepID=A0A0F8X9G1_9ZZZZ